MTTKFTGGCLCGAVRYRSNADPVGGGHCYCLHCRKSSGTAHCSHLVVPKAGFEVSGEVRFFDAPTDRGNLVSRGFCPTCGSPIFSTNTGMPDVVFPRASSLDDPEVFHPAMTVYTKYAPSWHPPNPNLPSFEAMPPPDLQPTDPTSG